MRKKITWINNNTKLSGGFIYGQKVRKILSSNFNIELKNIQKGNLKYLKPFYFIVNLLKLKKQKSDLFILNDILTTIIPLRKHDKNLALIYHIDSSVFSAIYRFIFFFVEHIAFFNLKKADYIVTISEYWKNYFLKKRYKNVYKIYPGFNLNDFKISNKEIIKFKKKYRLKNKPIIYIGNCQKSKGVLESFQVLKELNVHLVTSGDKKVNIPTINLDLDYKEYLYLLKASTIVITMSKFKEGWCISAHEAMLLKTPVIGSGLGGMKELLMGGEQIICQNFNILKQKTEELLKDKKKREDLGEKGYKYAKEFTSEKFKKDWSDLVKNLLNEN